MPAKKTVAPSTASGARSKKSAAAAKPAPGSARGSARKAKPSPAMVELLSLLPELDDEGIVFLLEQARTHRYNMEVERLDSVARRTVKRPAPVVESGGLVRPGAATGVKLERSTDGSTYHLVSGGVWKMFSASEMAAMVRMTRAEAPEADIGRRIHAWLERERRDALADLGIVGGSSPLLVGIVQALRTAFPLKKS